MSRRKKRGVHLLEVVQGVCGLAVYLNGYRIIGEKPWGGGPVLHRWQFSNEDLNTALAQPITATEEPPVVKPKKKTSTKR
jgi:hypothetical protein